MTDLVDAAVGAALFIADHGDAVVTWLILLAGGLAQAAALLGLDRLAAVSPRLHRLAEFLAGNWGRAANAARLVQIYRRDGATAALEELDRLAQAAAPVDPPGPGFPPASGVLPGLALLAIALPLAACQTDADPSRTGAAAGGLTSVAADVTGAAAKLDKLTGVEKDRRCALYLAGGDVATAFGLTDPAAAKAVIAALESYCGRPPTD